MGDAERVNQLNSSARVGLRVGEHPVAVTLLLCVQGGHVTIRSPPKESAAEKWA